MISFNKQLKQNESINNDKLKKFQIPKNRIETLSYL